jgi:serine/threonine protein kinase/formylglycine-generating enzyme required for sulfatase activity
VAFRSHRHSDIELVKGQLVGRYELIEILGSGAETTVWRARGVPSGNDVAVKVFRAIALRNPAALKSFKRDLAVLRDHPHANIIHVFDFGESNGAFYVAMELVGGAPLSHAAAAPHWSQEAVLEALEEIASALAWLHSHGVVHGDIRPSNIVSTDGSIKVMDFGPQRDSRQATLEAPHSYCPYASPERLLGRPLTPVSDLYSTAAVMYELLAGEPPDATAGLLEGAISEAPPMRDRVPEVSPELAGIVEECLNPDPALRPGAASDIAEQCRVLRGRNDASPKCGSPRKALVDRISASPLEAGEVSHLLMAICRILERIHSAGLAHPDLAPKNIYLSPDGHPHIESFPAPPPNATLAMTEPKYVAPEMLLTSSTTEEAGHLRSDIYVLGFIAYEALAGRDAFQRQFFKDGYETETDLFWMKWHADPAAHLQPIREVNPSVSEELSTLVQRMTEKDPVARMASLTEVDSAVSQVQRRFRTTDDIEVELPSDGGVEPTPDVSVRKPSPRAVSNMLLVVTLLACGPIAWQLLVHGSRTSQVLTNSWRWTEQKASRTWTRIGGMLHRPMPASLPVLSAVIDTDSGPMVLVPAGRCEIGSGTIPNESPAHTVYLSGFYIDKYEVSNGAYLAFTDSTGYPQPPAPSWDPDYFKKSTHPVLNVSWRDAQAFCVAAGKRLPTETEWEKAARGSSPASRFWANWTVEGLANLKGAGLPQPAPIGSFPADVSPFGAYDMAGNVHEWVNDQYGLYTGNPNSLERSGAAKVVRGGSYAVAPEGLSPSWRASLDPSVPAGSDSPVGFRCAADPSAVAADAGRQSINRPPAQSRP